MIFHKEYSTNFGLGISIVESLVNNTVRRNLRGLPIFVDEHQILVLEHKIVFSQYDSKWVRSSEPTFGVQTPFLQDKNA